MGPWKEGAVRPLTTFDRERKDMAKKYIVGVTSCIVGIAHTYMAADALKRAIEAAGQSVPVADAGLLSSYADGYQVSAFARPSVAALVQMGAVRGNSAYRLNPGAAISRAEMAVILHRVLTR